MIKQQTQGNLYQNESLKNFAELISNINLLKNKKYGCPWQNMQTHETLIPYLIEESHEFINSIKTNDLENMKEELGDLLLQIMLHSEIEREKNSFSIVDVINSLNHKIKSRHPYIFQERKKVSIKEAEQIWKEMKIKNEFNQTNKEVLSNLQSEYLTPIEEAEQINFQIEKYGFKWDNKNEILDKLNEEIEELKLAIKIEDDINIEEEFGDILFTLISLSKYLKINPHKSLKYANEKFKKRFSIIEKILGDRISNQSIKTFQKLWGKAKEKLKRANKNQNEKQ